MTTYSIALDPASLSSLDARDMLILEVQRGLHKRPYSLSPWMFYDARGSRIFEQITELDEYYPTRTERSILASCSDAIIAAACRYGSEPLRLVELGAGTAAKSVILLDAALKSQCEVLYAPVDVSSDALDVACESITASLPEVCISPIVANYVTNPPQLESFNGTTLGLYIGSSIGNFAPEEARKILRDLRSQLQPGDALLLGVDMVKDEPTLVAAYDDREGVTAEFNLNMLHRLNRELDADFDASSFRHRALWNSAQSRVEMHLESTRPQRVCIAAANLDVDFEEGESIHTENSHKFTDATVRLLLSDAGFELEQTWTDERGWYSVTLAAFIKERTVATQNNRATLDQHWAASAAGDLETEHQIYDDNAVCEYPQSGEKILGRRNLQALRGHHPAKPSGFAVRRIVGVNDLWVTEYVINYQTSVVQTVSIMEFKNGKVIHEVQYFAEPFAAPAWRSQWVEKNK